VWISSRVSSYLASRNNVTEPGVGQTLRTTYFGDGAGYLVGLPTGAARSENVFKLLNRDAC